MNLEVAKLDEAASKIRVLLQATHCRLFLLKRSCLPVAPLGLEQAAVLARKRVAPIRVVREPSVSGAGLLVDARGLPNGLGGSPNTLHRERLHALDLYGRS